MSVNIIVNMVDWVEENLEEKPTLDEMSAFVGYSPYYCSSKFHHYVGVPFKEYVAKRKLSLAAVELKYTDQRIIDVAVKYGFSSHEAFSRAFLKMYGYTPIHYRNNRPTIQLYPKANIRP